MVNTGGTKMFSSIFIHIALITFIFADSKFDRQYYQDQQEQNLTSSSEDGNYSKFGRFFMLRNNEDCGSRGCRAYPCYEKTAHCGNEGYLIAFGEKYCRRFKSKEIYDSFDEPGKKFVNCTGKCLIARMDEYMKNHTLPINCDDLTTNGFDSHPKCYLGCNFCEVCKTNKAALLHAYDLGDFFSLQAIKEVFAVIAECGIFACF